MKTQDLLATGPLTIEEFERLPDDGWRMELVRGYVIREPPAGGGHGSLAARIAGELYPFLRKHDLGEMFIAETGFVLREEPPTVRAPDVAFVREERRSLISERFVPFAPDLAVEIASPSNTLSEIQDKVMDYLDAGTRLVWVVDPGSRTVTAYRSRDEIRLVTEDGELDGSDVLPGFRLKLAELFAR